MINRLLHALSNRTGNFHEPMFASDPLFVPAVFNAEEQQLRALMLLHRSDTDYYLKAYLAAIEAYPDIKALADDVVTSYRLSDFPPRGVAISGGDFLSKENSVGYYTDVSSTNLPVNLTYWVNYFDSRLVTIVGKETGLVRRVNYILSGDAPHQTMRVEWPEAEVPFKGPLALTQHWVSGAMVEIQVEPSNFPYASVVARLQGNAYLMNLLVRNQLVDEFLAVPDDQRKMAIACVVLALANPSAYA